MAGEYFKWLARDIKPEKKRELTREEKLKNWWHYHKWHLLIAAVVLFVVVDIGADILENYRNQPDYAIAYVGCSYLPEEAADQLTQALAQLGEDLNGRGGVQVALHQYIVYPGADAETGSDSMSQTMLYAAQVQLAADLQNCDSYFFLMEDPEQFQEDYQILLDPEHTYPDSGEGTAYFAWKDCPVLTGLSLGSFTVETGEGIYTGSSQDVLSGLYFGRRGFWDGKTCPYPEGCEALWDKLIQGAAS